MMFTGLIEEVGRLRSVRRQGEAMVLTVSARKVLEDVREGDSIAVNGVCLTVVSFDAGSFTVDVMPETFRRTNLHALSPGAPVNLERAMRAGGRFGGHFVQGHVDGTGAVVSRTPEANAVVFRIRPDDPSLFRYLVPQGSVAVDGISLTVVSADRDAGTFTVSIIPHTLRETSLGERRPGDVVNLECDMIGKYVDHLLSLRLGSADPDGVGGGGTPETGGARSGHGTPAGSAGGLTEARLRELGF